MIEEKLGSILLLLLFSVIGGVGTLMALEFLIHENIVDYVTKKCEDKDDHQTLHHHPDKRYCKNGNCKVFASCSRL